ncbi:MAG: KpsF/GutQ family sugar-phosphate isomerase [Gammaproteobacteria bacterium]|jgi:arabinose-5-phosphate isomerase|nr:KpsF/GutQ family sugar-phosphate isomerase [Gammaproteobacteria bacterium]MBT3489400.1 KpsF/GutQ family sugar-phosphate isomerase [Gammaproteobacteria bacterium]MBT3718329.1 KpsF/GutQ family sugar-phosphate isomerase [Gammaproteobacteria bacterium]MBT3844062.1 KpsF/GutQ family sugar-phosphate isomerase [Gammaproteobacteria bacterium]MBT3892206.1 KpsF/GutQ family sugar-phosphate isomerase [Gammaproteobacteria bacterium]
MNHTTLTTLGKAVIQEEAKAIEALLERIDHTFEKACNIMLQCQGRIVVIGMGKSGHIGSKIAATLASTGSPAFFVHPGEASHGDLGMVTQSDVVVALSNSGETSEVLMILPVIKRLGIPMISLTGNPESTLAKASEVHLNIAVEKEACPLGLAPTSSTTATLVMGDALAIALLESRGFTAEDFARSHPAGALGRRLLLRIEDIMHKAERIPLITSGSMIRDALLEMTSKGLGMTAVVDGSGKILGIYTDGDLRRTIDHKIDVLDTPIDQVMTTTCTTIQADMLVEEALNIMDQKNINGLFVVDPQGLVVGALNMLDLLHAKAV